MIPRLVAARLTALAAQFPIVVVSGPRQSGKSTLVKALAADKPYFNLENPATRARIVDDPEGFLRSCPLGAVVDEAQRFPELASWLQAHVDENPVPGQFYLTGSNQPLLRSQVNQSLAGRAAYVTLPPFTVAELAGASGLPDSADQWMFRGFYPPLYDRPFLPEDWFASYIETYLERDLTQLARLKDLGAFQRFLRLCAGRTGQILNLSDLARDGDISHTTAKTWLSFLESSFLVYLLPPWHENYDKRLVKSPKLYFLDVGLAGALAGVTSAAQWAVHPLRGAFFETMVVADLIKTSWAGQPRRDWFFWSSPGGIEVDLIERSPRGVRAFEIKSTATFRPDQVKKLLAWGTLAHVEPSALTLLYDGTESFVHRGVQVMPWTQGGAS
jgi:hypothetical protein